MLRYQINASDSATFQTFLKEQPENIHQNVKMISPKLLSVWQVSLKYQILLKPNKNLIQIKSFVAL